MSSQKLIMENWRRFLKEEDERGERLDPKDVCLASYITPGSDATFILYRKRRVHASPEMVAGHHGT